ncbi:hypothetical protein BBI11_13005 [Planococcus maritimus]|uniref:hypothetical protein n=1 Tax=Planococcus maritimus TaxID=192421 RepID=UPI00080F06C6|nr:hypothetical protein [Planococcus maritimus]ANU17894.1 hypothetical protein BBI11_13005 [Planococcus maritimus]
MRRLGQLVIILICAGVFLSYMGYFEKPEDRVQEFSEAYNRQDIKKMISMIRHPEVDQINNTFNFAGAISNALLGVDVAELLINFMPLSEELLGYTGSRMYIDVQSSESDLLRTEAVVHAKVKTEYEGVSEEENLVFYLEKKDRLWYITDIK